MPEHDADREAIIALIHRNRIALWTNDYELYASCFVHEPYTSRWQATHIFGIHVRSGWEEISGRVRETMGEMASAHSLSRANAFDTAVENLMLRIEGSIAWATFNQRFPTPNEVIPSRGFTHEMRVFEKHGGAWKIAFLGYLEDDLVRDDSVMLRVDAEARIIHQTSAASRALESDEDLVIRAGRLRARDGRTNDRLQLAIRWAAGLDRGYLLRRASLAIVHDAGEGAPARVWWVIAESGKIWFAFGDAGPTDERLSAAAVTFGLSPVQLNVAKLVAEGRSLTQIAEQLGITANTARTHLDRIFNKTGVRTQTALVRMLLTAVSPI